MSQKHDFSYSEAFCRNLGLLSDADQQRLSNSLIVIAGCGGVGGFHAHTFARLGVGRFRLTDPDEFSVANFNRQIGANVNTVDRNKAEVTADIIRSINPDAEIEILAGGVSGSNAADFVRDANIVVDGVDFFSIEPRRQLFKAAREQNIFALTAAPLGFSSALLVFSPDGMSFDEYFNMTDDTPYVDKIINFLLGLSPAGLHIPYMDLSGVDPSTGRGPSSVVGVQLAASLLATQAIKLMLGREGVPQAPSYIQFDAYRQKMAKGHLSGGNRNWKQKIKRKLVLRKFREIGLLDKFLSLHAHT